MSQVSINSSTSDKNVKIVTPIEETYIPHRVFLNQVDSFNAKHITSYLTDQIFGSRGLEGEGGFEESAGKNPNYTGSNYEFIGTLSYGKKTEDILYTIEDNFNENFCQEIMKCGTIIYDISTDKKEIPKALKVLKYLESEFKKIENVGPKTFTKYNETKTFILISTMMTWGITKPLNEKDPNFSFAEEDYRKRKCHPNFKEHIDCEKEVVKMGEIYPDKFKTYVVCTGVTYGAEEDILDFFFKKAWLNQIIPIFGNGRNFIPLINVADLAKILFGVIEVAPIKPQYMLAVHPIPTTFKDIIISLSKSLGVEKIKYEDKEAAFLHEEISQYIYDIITVNLRMIPNYVDAVLQITWSSDRNLADNMDQIADEFKRSRNLKPIKIVLHGPPGSGKTTLAKKLCNYYGISYVFVDNLIDDILKEGDIELKSQLSGVLQTTDGPLPDNVISQYLKKFLGKNLCQNRGFILDDYPKTIEQAGPLFDLQLGEGQIDTTHLIPNYVISLDGPDDVLCERIMSLAGEDVEGTIMEEETYLKLLNEFRHQNTEDNTVLNYFDEIEIHPVIIDVTDLKIEDYFDRIIEHIGSPISFGMNLRELAELNRIEEAERHLEEEKNEIYRKMMEERAQKEYEARMEKWLKVLETLQMEEEQIIIARSAPLRHYLMKYVFPTLIKGLITLVKIKPEDPLDFLAEYLFKNNPEGKMFDPSYTRIGEKLLKKCDII